MTSISSIKSVLKPRTSQLWSRPKRKPFGRDVAASIRKNFAFNLKRLMKAAGVNQRELAESLEVSESRISNWAREKNFPEEGVFDLLRAKYGWTYDQLVIDPGAMASGDVIEFAKSVVRSAGFEVSKKP